MGRIGYDPKTVDAAKAQLNECRDPERLPPSDGRDQPQEHRIKQIELAFDPDAPKGDIDPKISRVGKIMDKKKMHDDLVQLPGHRARSVA